MEIDYFRSIGYDKLFTVDSYIKIHLSEYPKNILIFAITNTSADFIMKTQNIEEFKQACARHFITYQIYSKNIPWQDNHNICKYVRNITIECDNVVSLQLHFMEFYKRNDIYHIHINKENFLQEDIKNFINGLFEY